MNRLERIKGSLLGGAVGDALGASVEFLEWPAIEAKYGPQGGAISPRSVALPVPLPATLR